MRAERSGLVDCGWESMSTDSVRPWCPFGIGLTGNWQDSVYTARIEYPELRKISSDDLKRWNLSESDIPEWPVMETWIAESLGSASFCAGFLPIIKRDGAIYAIISYKWTVSSSESLKRAPSRSIDPKDRYTRTSVLADGRWAKIRVDRTGVYKLSYSTLRSMGFKDPSKVRLFGYGGAVLPETDLQDLTDDLPEQPMWRGKDYMLFYAQGPVSWKKGSKGYEHTVNTYSDWGYYFLTDRTDSAPASFGTMATDTVTGRVINTYPDYMVYDPDEYSWYRSGRRMFEDYDYSGGSARSYSFELKGLAGDTVGVKVAFSAASARTTKVGVNVNGTKIGDMSVRAISSSEAAAVAEKEFEAIREFREQNTVRLVHDREPGVSGRLDYIRLNYKRRLALYGSSTLFRVEEECDSVSFVISGSTPDVQVWRISSGGEYSVVPSTYQDGTTITLGAYYDVDDVLLAVNVKGSIPEPERVGEVANQNLHALDSVDMVIVVPASGRLMAQAERLAAAHRRLDSLSVAVVRADMVYNEFSSGTPDATALRRFLKMLYDRGMDGTAPRYLMLMGNGAWDNRMHVSDWKGQNPDDYLLCYESYESLSHTASYVMEDYFGLLDDSEGRSLLTEKVDLGVGRLPVSTASEARAEVDQLIAYMSGAYSGAWCNKILVLGDDGDNNTHMQDADRIAGVYEKASPAIDVRKIYWDAYQMGCLSGFSSFAE